MGLLLYVGKDVWRKLGMFVLKRRDTAVSKCSSNPTWCSQSLER